MKDDKKPHDSAISRQKDELLSHQFQPGNKLGGRPKGRQNKLTEIKQKFIRDQDKIVGLYDDFLTNGNRREKMEVLKMVFAILPREDKLQHEIAQLVMTKVVHKHEYKGMVHCPKCEHSFTIEDMGNGGKKKAQAQEQAPEDHGYGVGDG